MLSSATMWLMCSWNDAYDSHQNVYKKVIGFPFLVMSFAQSRLSSSLAFWLKLRAGTREGKFKVDDRWYRYKRHFVSFSFLHESKSQTRARERKMKKLQFRLLRVFGYIFVWFKSCWNTEFIFYAWLHAFIHSSHKVARYSINNFHLRRRRRRRKKQSDGEVSSFHPLEVLSVVICRFVVILRLLNHKLCPHYQKLFRRYYRRQSSKSFWRRT